MKSIPEIKDLMRQTRLDEALAAVNELIAARPDDDDALYTRGKIYWRLGDKSAAITDYNAAVAANPASPAALALKQATEIMDFYNTDLYNP